uniref:Reticulocalbin-3 n=1 Tax=Liphistius sp. SGP-2016 TaxID=1905180 RepID=A0A4Q8K2X6_9ARAC
MKAVVLFFTLISLCLAAEETTTTTTSAPSTPKSTEKPTTQPHQSSLGEDSQPQQTQQAQEEYRQLEPDEVKALLLKVVDEHIDKDKDGYVSVEELKNWLHVLQERVIQDNVQRQWDYYNPQSEDVLSWEGYYPEQKQVLSWERYKNFTYPEEALKQDPNSEEGKAVHDMLRRADRRWKNADADEDGSLSKEEFRDYIHPEESQKAGGVVVLEAMEDMDTDKNGEVSLEEYMIHLQKVSGPEKEDPNWAAAQQGHFTNYLDKDKDGSLNNEEMREWVVPTYDRSEAEAWRLISIADADQDSKLSKDDIAKYHEYFLTLLPPEYWVQEDPTESSRHDEF